MNWVSATTCITFGLALAMTGCAALTWQKPDTDPAQAAKDLEQCQQKAMLSLRRLGAMGNQAPIIVGSPSGPVSVISPASNATSDLVAQQSILSECMRARGYHLVRQN